MVGGAPSIVHGNGVFWLAARMRTQESIRGLRGYEIRILRSDDGANFEAVHRIRREDVPIPGFERPALLKDPATGKFKLYACGPFGDQPWNIIKLTTPIAPTSSTRRPRDRHPPPAKTYERDQSVIEYKDPVIIHAEGAYHAYLIGYMGRNERIYHQPGRRKLGSVGNPNRSVMELSGWHDFFILMSSVLPLGFGYLFVYEGSSTKWYDPVYNALYGPRLHFDLHHIIDLTPNGPLAVSTTPSEISRPGATPPDRSRRRDLVYAEATCPNDTHEIRRYRIAK